MADEGLQSSRTPKLSTFELEGRYVYCKVATQKKKQQLAADLVWGIVQDDSITVTVGDEQRTLTPTQFVQHAGHTSARAVAASYKYIKVAEAAAAVIAPSDLSLEQLNAPGDKHAAQKNLLAAESKLHDLKIQTFDDLARFNKVRVRGFSRGHF